jgi:NTE family protein
MTDNLQETLDYESKIDRSAHNINRLIAEGERSARRFLAERATKVEAASTKR